MQIKRTPALVATIVGGALIATVAGTGTMAQWSKSADVPGFTVTSGDLDVAAQPTVFTDQTEGRPDVGHAVDLSTWRAVPGDSLRIDVPLDVALSGDNMLAEVDGAGFANQIDMWGLSDDHRNHTAMDLFLVTPDGTVLPNEYGVYRLQADDSTEEGRGAIRVPAALDGKADITVRVEIYFQGDTPDRVLADTDLARLQEGSVTIRQVQKYS